MALDAEVGLIYMIRTNNIRVRVHTFYFLVSVLCNIIYIINYASSYITLLFSYVRHLTHHGLFVGEGVVFH